MRKKIPLKAGKLAQKGDWIETVVPVPVAARKMAFFGTLGGMFRHGLSKHGVHWAYPSEEVLSCFKKAMLPIKPEVRNFVECLQQMAKQRPNSRGFGAATNQSLVDDLLDLLNTTGPDRTKKAKHIKSAFAQAIDILAADTVISRHRRRILISIKRNTFPPSLLRYEKLSNIAASEMFLPLTKWGKAQDEIDAALKSDATILRIPIACVAIEYVRRYVQEYSKLPTKLEVRRRITKLHKKETLELDDSTWAKVWKEAGLDELPRREKT